MRLTALLPLVLELAGSLVNALPAQQDQHVLGLDSLQQPPDELATGDDYSCWEDDGKTGTGRLSQWSRSNKEEFIAALRKNQAKEWIVVMGNEAGDLDSLVSAMALSFMYNHLDPPQKAVALLQTEQDALDLRPENSLSLHYAKMSGGHRDLLTIDELPIKPEELGHRIQGIALVDHNVPRREWNGAQIAAIIDHHADQGVANGTANPRIIEVSGSCSSLVTRYILDHLPGADKAYPKPGHKLFEHDADSLLSNSTSDAELFAKGPLPTELVELLLRTIAIDSDALSKDSRQPVDKESAQRLFPHSSWKHRKLKEVMKVLDKDLTASRKALDDLDLRSLLRRDWKGDSIRTKSKKYPHIALGFASAPVSLEEQIERTPEKTVPEWFAIERAWTAEIQADVSVALTNFHHPKTGEKTRQLAVVVAHGYGKRLHEGSANRLFKAIKNAVEKAGVKELKDWKRPDGKKLLPRRAVYEYQSDIASRKFWRPIIEKSVREWEG
ncbi:hypothetical protein JCM10207_005051 [Rhodosporidiobolus poonsookiae]